MGEASPGDSGKVAALKAQLRKARLHDASRRRVLQSSQTLMALQGLRLDALSSHLTEKRKKKNDVRSVIFKSGHSVMLTSDLSMSLVQQADDRRAAASAAKEQRKKGRAAAKAASDAEKARKQAIRDRYQEELREWNEACDAIRLANPTKHRKLGLPPRPKNPLYARKKKKDATEEPADESEDEAESEESDDTDTSDSDPMDVDLVHTDDDNNDWEDW
ncbi:hypothetical protein AURDEDRAFT_157409 [Auricularia subglabra TFB-10046 SS5]|nr:hypothetical protein AURDEDRAFT_157409 [Auricularia subglabra TFB-10046 SS5]